MPNQLNLSQQQLQQLNTITSNGIANFAEGYRYIFNIIQNNANVYAGTKFWFQNVAKINSNNPVSAANIFIRGVTISGLAWDGLSQVIEQARAAQTQAISDAIVFWRYVYELPGAVREFRGEPQSHTPPMKTET